jgi:hypothetical protein
MLRDCGDHQIDVHVRESLRREGGAGFHQYFEPHAETIGVELLVCAWLANAPQVEVEDTRQLAGCRQRHELAAILESTALDDAVKHLGWQSRDDVHETWRVQNAIEQRTRVSNRPLRWSVASPIRAATTSTMNGFRFRHR